MKIIKTKYLTNDLLGGVTAGIVALPLALAFGEQSGLGAAAGLYGAAFIAFFAAMFGGTNTQISGPTAPMTALSMVVVAGLLQASEGRMELALPIILSVFLLSGLFQIGLGFLKLGTYIKFIPHTVVSGFMTGIGVIILITQLLPAMGYYPDQDPEVVESYLPQAEDLILERILREETQDGILVLEDFGETQKRAAEVTEEDIRVEADLLASNGSRGVIGALEFLPRAVKRINALELMLALLTIVMIYGFKRVTKAVPSTLVALVLVTAGAVLTGSEYRPIQAIPAGLPALHLEIFTGFDLGKLMPYLVTALMLAMLGAIDSLLTSVVADNMTRTRHDPNQELVGQGIGNGMSALFGGLPGAGATIRTVVNIQAGGKTKLSGVISGLLLFVTMLFLGPIASKIPAAVLAGILITVGFGVMDIRGLKALPRMDNAERFILVTVLLLTVFWQLVYAVFVGLIMAAFVFLKRMSDSSSERVEINDLKLVQDEDPLWDDEQVILPEIREKVLFKHMNGPMFFGMVNEFGQVISTLPDVHLLVIRMEQVPFIDLSGVRALERALDELHEKGVVVALCGANGQVRRLLLDMHVIPDHLSERHVFNDFNECRLWLRSLLLNKRVDKVDWQAEIALREKVE